MKLLMIFVDGFEDTEAIATLDVLRRGNDEVVTASLMPSTSISPKCSKGYVTDTLLSDIDYHDFDGLIIPGGPGAIKLMPNMEIVSELITYFYTNNKLVAAICAAPNLIGRLGYLKDKNYTVHPGCEGPIIGGNYLRNLGVVKDHNIITAKSMYYSIQFALEIHKYFHGQDSSDKLELHCQGE